MRLTTLALFLLACPVALSQSPANFKQMQMQPSTQPWTDFSKLPPSLLTPPKTSVPKLSWNWEHFIAAESAFKVVLAQNDRVPTPFPLAKIEPIPTQWPDVTIGAIPSQWQNLNFVPITPNSQ